MTRSRLIAGFAALAAVLAAAPAAQAKPTILISGSTSMYPLLVPLAKSFKARAGFRILQGGSDIGIADVSRGRVTLGASSRDPQPSDPGGLVFNKVARDGVCIITSKRNPISNLSQGQIQAIFSGRIRNWKQVPGARVSGPIDLVVRTAASGTQDAFQNIFMGQNLRVAGSASQKGSNGLVQQAVASSPAGNAIGYVSFDFTRGTHTVAYKGVACNLRNAKSGVYGGVRNFWLVSRGRATGAAAAFINYIRSNATARRIVASDWVPLR